MTITAKYPSVCCRCRRPIRVGERIEWSRGAPAYHTQCPADATPTGPQSTTAEPQGEQIHISRGQGYGGRPYAVGQVLRQRDGRAITVLRASKKYVREDGMSVGVGDEEGYVYSAVCRPATQEEIAALEQQEQAREARRLARTVIQCLVASPDLALGAVYASGQHTLVGEEIDLPTTGDRLYGRGAWVVLTADRIWIVRNNGADGDDWSRNNVVTGGAGAVGWYLPRDAELECWIREAVRLAE